MPVLDDVRYGRLIRSAQLLYPGHRPLHAALRLGHRQEIEHLLHNGSVAVHRRRMHLVDLLRRTSDNGRRERIWKGIERARREEQELEAIRSLWARIDSRRRTQEYRRRNRLRA